MADEDTDRRRRSSEEQGDRPAPLPVVERSQHADDDDIRDKRLERIIAALQSTIETEIETQVVELRREVTTELYQGPLPPPRILEGYNRVVPGSAAMIMKNYDEQAQHRRQLESYALRWENIRSLVGIAAGLLVSVAFLVVGYLIAMAGYPAEGVLLAGVSLASLVGVFIYGTRARREERLERSRIMMGKEEVSERSPQQGRTS